MGSPTLQLSVTRDVCLHMYMYLRTAKTQKHAYKCLRIIVCVCVNAFQSCNFNPVWVCLFKFGLVDI